MINKLSPHLYSPHCYSSTSTLNFFYRPFYNTIEEAIKINCQFVTLLINPHLHAFSILQSIEYVISLWIDNNFTRKQLNNNKNNNKNNNEKNNNHNKNNNKNNKNYNNRDVPDFWDKFNLSQIYLKFISNLSASKRQSSVLLLRVSRNVVHY